MYKLRNMIVCVTITSLLLAGCGAAQAAPVATEVVTTADTTTVAEVATTADTTTVAEVATTADTTTVAEVATTADTATVAEEATTADTATATEVATTATEATTAETVVTYIIVYDDGVEVPLYREGEMVYFFKGGGQFKMTDNPVKGIENLPKEGARIPRDQITGQLGETVDAVKQMMY